MITQCGAVVAAILLSACGRFNFGERNSDASDGDPGRDAIPDNVNRAFVTSKQFVAGSFGGITSLDAACADAASMAGLPQGTYIAYASTSGQLAADRLRVARGWYRTDGLPFVDTVDDLVARRMFRPVQVDEYGVKVEDFVATGTTSNEMLGENCSDWTSAGMVMGGVSDGEELAFTGWGTRSCTELVRLLCFQTDHQTPVVPDVQTGRITFLVPLMVTITGGLAAADTLCMDAASTAQLNGQFRALLATSTASPASRFTLGPTWVRRDGIRLAPTASDVLAGNLEAAISVRADGTHSTGGSAVFTGSDSPAAAGTLATTCADWTTTASTATWGRPQQSGHKAFNEAGGSCTFGFGLYCLEI